MSQKMNLEIIRSTYEGPSSSNAQHLLAALSEHVEWTEAAGFPYGGTYKGVEAEGVYSGTFKETGKAFQADK